MAKGSGHYQLNGYGSGGNLASLLSTALTKAPFGSLCRISLAAPTRQEVVCATVPSPYPN